MNELPEGLDTIAETYADRFLDKRRLFDMSGLSGEMDTAIPQMWADEARDKTGIDSSNYVWWYPSREDSKYGGYSLMGRPLSIAQLLIQAIKSGQCIPFRMAKDLIGMSLDEGENVLERPKLFKND